MSIHVNIVNTNFKARPQTAFTAALERLPEGVVTSCRSEDRGEGRGAAGDDLKGEGSSFDSENSKKIYM